MQVLSGLPASPTQWQQAKTLFGMETPAERIAKMQKSVGESQQLPGVRPAGPSFPEMHFTRPTSRDPFDPLHAQMDGLERFYRINNVLPDPNRTLDALSQMSQWLGPQAFNTQRMLTRLRSLEAADQMMKVKTLPDRINTLVEETTRPQSWVG